MASSTSNLDLVSQSQSSKETTINALFDAASTSIIFGRRQSTTSGLTWGYYGGYFPIGGDTTLIANGTLTLDASTTNYVQALKTTGAVSSNTTGFDSDHIPLYTIVTGTSTVSSYTDHRTIYVIDKFSDFDEDPFTTTGTTWGYKAGNYRDRTAIYDFSAGTIALTDDATNYVEINTTTNLVSVNQTGFTSDYIPLRTVVVASGVQTSSTDKRSILTIWDSAGSDSTAFHNDTTGEIYSVSLKAAPVDNDVLLIEDSAASYAKKKITIGSLPDYFDEDPATTTGLTWGYKAGVLLGYNVPYSISAGTIALTDNSENYIYIDVTDQTIKKSVSAYPVGSIPIRQVTTSGGSQTVSAKKSTKIVSQRPIQVVGSESYAATITVDMDKYDVCDITMTGDATVNFTNGLDSQQVLLRVRQDTSGARSATWGTMVRGSDTITLPTLTATAFALDYIGFRYNETDLKYDCVAVNKGF